MTLERQGIAIVGVSTAVVFAVLAWKFGAGLDLISYSYLATVGVPLAAIDMIEQRLPSALVFPSYIVLTVLFATSAVVNSSDRSFVRALVGMVTLAGLYLVLALSSAGGLGAGDVKLGGLLGLAMAWVGWPALLAGTLLGWFLALLVVISGPRREAATDAVIPLGPYLLLGAFFAIVATSPA
ncbi:MAG: prepilin peptidase [Actinomycetota bacterium]|nr:prepilin peptidase [Actinomycetota bacterium]